MPITSFDRLLVPSRLASSGIERGDQFLAAQSQRLLRKDKDELRGKLGRARSGGGSSGGANTLSRLIDKRTPLRRHFGAGRDGHGAAPSMSFDQRQRAVVKIHYFNHAGGGGAALKAHARYVARDAAARDGPSEDVSSNDHARDGQPAPEHDAQARAKAHAAYLARDGATSSVFYDARADGVDGAARAEAWAGSDRRHFRIILSAEEGARLQDLPSYTREVMARAEAVLGTKLAWVAVDHHDTDNPHTHIIVRGRRANGQDLVLPKDFIKHGFRGLARDVATEWLGPRTAADERLALEREVIRHAPTRLDRMIAAQLPEDLTVRLSRLQAPDGDPTMTQALKGRARELERIGLAREVNRNTLAFEPNWRDRLQAMELHLDIRKRIVQERTLQKHLDLERAMKQVTRGLLGR
ncbi:MAG: hypothetical protein ABL883_04020 [Terricaulis sp.]